MTIERDGIEIELTPEETIKAWLEIEFWNNVESIEKTLGDVILDMPETEKREVAMKLETRLADKLADNCNYGEAYWDSVQEVVEDWAYTEGGLEA